MSEPGTPSDNIDPLFGEDTDGSRYVWFYFKSNNLPYEFQPVETFSKCEKFVGAEINVPQMMDVAWWRQMVGVYDPHLSQPIPDSKYPLNLRTAFGDRSYQLLEKEYGKAFWLRHVGAVSQLDTVNKPAKEKSWLGNIFKAKDFGK